MNSAAVLSILISLGIAMVAVLWGMNERRGGGVPAAQLEEFQRAADADVRSLQGQLDRTRDELEGIKDENRNLRQELAIEKEAVADLMAQKERLIARLDSVLAGGEASEGGREWTDEEVDQRIETEDMVMKIREQLLPAPLGYQMVTWKEMREALAESFLVVPEAHAGDQSLAYAAMGFVTPGTDVRARTLDFLESQLGAALYVGDRQMLFNTDGTTRSVHDRTALASELVRYMHDGAAGLYERMATMPANGDARSALWALSTGDVQQVKTRLQVYQQSNLAAGADEYLQSPTEMSREEFEGRIPAFIREERLFAYSLGQRFAQALHEEGSWEAIDAALARPPASTSEVLHPELYLAPEPFRPDNFDWLRVDTEVGKVKPVWDDVAGELRIALMLNQSNFLKRMADVGQPDILDMPALVEKGYEHFAGRDGSRAAAGWRGDRFLVYRTPGVEGDASVYWRSRWADAGEAEEFAGAIRAALSFRHGLELPADGSWAAGDGRAVKVEVRPGDHQVVVIDAGRRDFGETLRSHFDRIVP